MKPAAGKSPAIRPGGYTILDSFLSLGSGEVIARLVAFIGTAYLARRLGVEGFGVIGFAVALCGYLAIAVSAGFNSLGAREVARRPEAARAIAGGTILVRLALAMAAVLVAVLVSVVLPKPQVIRVVVVLTSFSFLTLALDTSWVYKGLERTRWVAMALTLSQVIYVVMLFTLVQSPRDIYWVPVAQVVGELGAALTLGLPLLKGTGAMAELAEGISLLKRGLTLTLSRLLRALIYTFDIVLLGFWLGEEPVGLYSAAYRFCFLVLAVGIALHTAYLPAFARLPAGDLRAFSKLMRRSLGTAWSLALPMAVGGSLLAEPILVTLFGSEYAPARSAFSLLLVSIGLVFMHAMLHSVFLSLDRLESETRIVAAGAALNVALNFVLIPRFGISGAALATVAAEALILAVGGLSLARVGARAVPAQAFRTVLATAIMSLILLWLGPHVLWPVRLVTGMAAYVAALAALRALPEDLLPSRQRSERGR